MKTIFHKIKILIDLLKIGGTFLYLRFSVIIECLQSRNKEKKQVALYLLKFHKFSFFTSDIEKKYKNIKIPIYRDGEYPYVIHNNKRLYLKKEWNDDFCAKYYRYLLCEQDEASPHKYITDNARKPEAEDVVADIGAAEGIFTLDIIDNVGQVYLFECDQEWMEPLEKTFCQWKDKIHIVPLYIGSKVQGSTTTLDAYFDGKDIDYIKADIEGAEEDMLLGGAYSFSSKVKKAIICTYHKPDAEKNITCCLDKYGFKYQFNEGYCLYYFDMKTFKPPRVRKGGLFAYKADLNINREK